MASGVYGVDANGVPLNAGTPERNSLALIAGAVQGQGGGGIPVTPAPLVGTYVPFAIASSGSGTIPITAKRWSFENSGSGNDSTMNGTIMAGNITRSDQGSPATQITLVAGAANIITGFYSTT